MDDPSRTTSHLVMRSLGEAARDCDVPEDILRRWLAEGALSAITIGSSPMVSLADVAALRDRRAGIAPRRRRAGARRATRALGLANLAVGTAELLAALGVGPLSVHTTWGVALAAATLVVGVALVVVAGHGRWG